MRLEVKKSEALILAKLRVKGLKSLAKRLRWIVLRTATFKTDIRVRTTLRQRRVARDFNPLTRRGNSFPWVGEEISTSSAPQLSLRIGARNPDRCWGGRVLRGGHHRPLRRLKGAFQLRRRIGIAIERQRGGAGNLGRRETTVAEGLACAVSTIRCTAS